MSDKLNLTDERETGWIATYSYYLIVAAIALFAFLAIYAANAEPQFSTAEAGVILGSGLSGVVLAFAFRGIVLLLASIERCQRIQTVLAMHRTRQPEPAPPRGHRGQQPGPVDEAALQKFLSEE